MPITANIYERVLRITTSVGSGTAFTLEIDDQQYLVTARHLLPAGEDVTLALEIRGQRWEGVLRPLPGVHREADVAVMRVAEALTPTLPVIPSFDQAIYSQECFFLGYPYGMSLVIGDEPTFALVKHGILSGSHRRADGLHIIYVDGFNNPGFSGGPVVFLEQGSQALHIAGVVSGYRFERQQVQGLLVSEPNLLNEEQRQAFVQANTGIVIATDIKHAIEAISPESVRPAESYSPPPVA
jgi:Trypsin-like peptidase domain